jgi:hypothetical protein
MVEKPTSPITAGNSLTAKCVTDSSNSVSPGTISWYRNGQQITSGVTPSRRPDTDGGTIYMSQLKFTNPRGFGAFGIGGRVALIGVFHRFYILKKSELLNAPYVTVKELTGDILSREEF